MAAGLDSDGFGALNWNPFGAYFRLGAKLLVKPKLVMDVNPSRRGANRPPTHPSVITAIIGYVVIALKGKGSMVLADASMQACDFDNPVKQPSLPGLVNRYRNQGVDIVLADMRGFCLTVPIQRSCERSERARGRPWGRWPYGFSYERIDGLRINNYGSDEFKRHRMPSKHDSTRLPTSPISGN